MVALAITRAGIHVVAGLLLVRGGSGTGRRRRTEGAGAESAGGGAHPWKRIDVPTAKRIEAWSPDPDGREGSFAKE